MTEARPRLQDLGIQLGRCPAGPTDSVRDVAGVRVGHVTLHSGDGPLVVGAGPVRTGLSVLTLPGDGPWAAAVHVINGFGKSVGLLQAAEFHEIESPIFFTNTLSVGAVLEGYLRHVRRAPGFDPDQAKRNVVVMECNDGFLNDLWGLHVRPAHVDAVLKAARRDEDPTDGAVGAGYGMSAFGLKGGLGSASRRLATGGVVASLVLLNCGQASDLRFWGRPVFDGSPRPGAEGVPEGSIIILLVTDAACGPVTLERMARRATHGLARLGATSQNGSGDIVLAVSTGGTDPGPVNGLFLATVEAVEGAIWNALLAARPVVGRDHHHRAALDANRLVELYRTAP